MVGKPVFAIDADEEDALRYYITGGDGAGKVLNTVSFKSDDGKCYNPEAPGNLPNSPSADASTNALATGFAVAGLIVSLVLM